MNITMKNGEVYSQYIEDASGSVSQPLDEAQLQRKAASCLEGMPEKKFMQLVNEIRTIDSAASLPDISC